MKRFAKVFLTSAIMVCALQSNVFADEVQTQKVIDTEVGEDSTFYIKEDNTLWVNNQGEFKQICDDTKYVSTSANYFGNCALVVKNDNSLYLYNIDSDELTFLAENVADIAEDSSFIVTPNNELYEVVFEITEDGYTLNQNKLIAEDVENVVTSNYYGDEAFCLFIKTDGTLWAYGNDSSNVMGQDFAKFSKPTQILSNVDDVAINYFNGFYFLNTAGEVYFVGEYRRNNETYTLEEPLLIAKDVKEIECSNFDDFYYIKNDNSLWSDQSNTTTTYIVHSTSSYATEDEVEKPTIEEEYFTKIADNATDIASSHTHTTYVTVDGDLMGYGSNSNNQLGDAESPYLDNFDENGFREITTDVKSAGVNDNITTAIKNDNTLYGLGKNLKGEEVTEETKNGTNTLTRMAEDVSFAQSNWYVSYVQGDNNVLYQTGGLNLTPEESEIVMENYTTSMFDYLGIEYTSYQDILDNEEKYYKILEEKTSAFSNEEVEDFVEFIETTQSEVINSFELQPVATDVLMGDIDSYLTTSNVLYELTDNAVDYKQIATGVKEYANSGNNDIVIVGTDDKLYSAKKVKEETRVFDYELYDYSTGFVDSEQATAYSGTYLYDENGNFEKAVVTQYIPLDDYEFKYSGVNNVKTANIDGYEGYVLKNDGTLWYLNNLLHDYIYIDDDGQYNGVVFVGEQLLNLSDLDVDRSIVSNTDVFSGYIENGKYSINYCNDQFLQFSYYQDGKVVSSYLALYNKNDLCKIGNDYYEMTKVADNVKNFSFGGSNAFYVNNNNELFGKGDNDYNQLGIQDETRIYEFIKIMDDVEMVSNDYATTIVVKTDGTLIGMGLNVNGELGFEGVGYNYDPYRFYKPLKIEIQ